MSEILPVGRKEPRARAGWPVLPARVAGGWNHAGPARRRRQRCACCPIGSRAQGQAAGKPAPCPHTGGAAGPSIPGAGGVVRRQGAAASGVAASASSARLESRSGPAMLAGRQRRAVAVRLKVLRRGRQAVRPAGHRRHRTVWYGAVAGLQWQALPLSLAPGRLRSGRQPARHSGSKKFHGRTSGNRVGGNGNATAAVNQSSRSSRAQMPSFSRLTGKRAALV